MEKGEKSIHHGQPCNYKHAEENLPFVLNSKATSDQKFHYQPLLPTVELVKKQNTLSEQEFHPEIKSLDGSESSVDFREVFTAKL